MLILINQTVLGMNLFDFNSGGNDAHEFTISKRFWIFPALTVPLTLLTLGSWYLFSRRRYLKREQRWHRAGHDDTELSGVDFEKGDFLKT